jgi:RNA polymerase sigma factor (sigma-70 family)
MPEATDFPDLIKRVRRGDEAAAEELVRRFEPFIQRLVRIRRRQRVDDERLRLHVGLSDVCQSVFRSFREGLKNDRYRLEQPADLERLLQAMIRFNIATKARRSSVKLRGLIDDFDAQDWSDSAPGPEKEVDAQDLADAIQGQFNEDELEIFTLRLDEAPWAEIAEKLGCTADAARVKLSRAIARVREVMKRGDGPDA